MKILFLVFLVFGLISCEEWQSPEEYAKSQNDYFNKIVSLPDNQACKKISEFEAWMTIINQDSTTKQALAENYKIASKEASRSDLKFLCSIEEVKNKSLTRLEFTKDHEQIIFHCPKPKMINEKTYGNEATYIITGNYYERAQWVFGVPSNPYSYEDFYIKLSKEKGFDSFQYYDFYITHGDKIYLESGELDIDLSHYSLRSPSTKKSKYNGGHWSISRDTFKLTSERREVINKSHHIVGNYSVTWWFDLVSDCYPITKENLHNFLFDLVENEHEERLKKQEILSQQKEKARKKSIERQKKENKI